MLYKIKSIHFSDNDSVYVSAGYSEMVMRYLIAFIQFEFDIIANGYGLSPLQVGFILNSVYGFKIINPTDGYIVIDMFEIWERYCVAAYLILNIGMFQNDKLNKELIKQFRYILME